MRLVLDTNVVVSALLWGGTPRVLFEAARQQKIELFTSVPLLSELTDVLNRSKFERKITASSFTLDEVVDGYAALVGLVLPEPTLRIAPDPDDDLVIGTALAAKANLIVSGDAHLLELKAIQGISIVKTAVAVGQIGSLEPR